MMFEIGGAYAYALWTDAVLPEPSPELTRLNEFYNEVHLPEVLHNNPGFVTAMRGGRTSAAVGGSHARARYLALYGVADEQGTIGYLARNVDGKGEPPRYSALPPSFPGSLVSRGRGFYRRVELASGGSATTAVILVAGRTAAGASLNAVMSECGFHRASRYRLVRDLNRAGTSCPQEMDVYEAAAETAAGCLASYRASVRADAGTDVVYDVLSTTTRSETPAQPVPADR